MVHLALQRKTEEELKIMHYANQVASAAHVQVHLAAQAQNMSVSLSKLPPAATSLSCCYVLLCLGVRCGTLFLAINLNV